MSSPEKSIKPVQLYQIFHKLWHAPDGHPRGDGGWQADSWVLVGHERELDPRLVPAILGQRLDTKDGPVVLDSKGLALLWHSRMGRGLAIHHSNILLIKDLERKTQD